MSECECVNTPANGNVHFALSFPCSLRLVVARGRSNENRGESPYEIILHVLGMYVSAMNLTFPKSSIGIAMFIIDSYYPTFIIITIYSR